MPIAKITEYPGRVLLEAGHPVEDFDENLASTVENMLATMYSAHGVGLAASQIGLSLRLFVTDCDGLKIIAANPEIIVKEGVQQGEEGCLSIVATRRSILLTIDPGLEKAGLNSAVALRRKPLGNRRLRGALYHGLRLCVYEFMKPASVFRRVASG